MVDKHQNNIDYGESPYRKDDEAKINNKIVSALELLAEDNISDEVDLWPGILRHITRRTSGNYRRRPSYKALVVVVSAIILASVVLWASPTFRAGVAHAIESVSQFIGVELSVKGNRVVYFGPPPSFIIKQPSYLPEYYKLVSEEYHPENVDLPSIKEEHISPNSTTTDLGKGSNLNQEQFVGSYVILKYEAGPGNYLQLTERPLMPQDKLPTGEEIKLTDQKAILERNGVFGKLTWISDNVWIELGGTLPDIELIKVANNLVVTQVPTTPSVTGITPNPQSGSSDTMSSSFCNPTDYAPIDKPLLGEVKNQKMLGTVVIQFWNREIAPIDVFGGGLTTDVLEQAITALQDPTIQWQDLSYPSIGGPYIWSDSQSCLIVAEKSNGYIVVEVWDHKVNVGFGGDGKERTEQAIEALTARLDKKH